VIEFNWITFTCSLGIWDTLNSTQCIMGCTQTRNLSIVSSNTIKGYRCFPELDLNW